MNLRPTSKMLIGFLLTFVTMAITAWAGFLGTKAVVRGGPGVIESVEITAKNAFDSQSSEAHASAEAVIANELAQMAVKAAVSNTLQKEPEQFAAVSSANLEFGRMAIPGDSTTPPDDKTAARLKTVAGEIESISIALAAIQPQSDKLLDSAKTAAKRTKETLENNDPAATALAAAAHAAKAAAHGAGAAHSAGQTSDSEADASKRSKAVAEVRIAAVLTEAAANAVKAAVKAAGAPADENSKRPEKNPRLDLSACSDAANRAIASAAAARKAVESLKYKNPEVVLQHASIAALAAADTAVLAARANAKAEERDVPEDVEKTEIAAAAGRISLWWQLIPYLLITISEICISVVGLELAFAVAPASMKSFVTACWLLTVFLAGILNAQVTPFYNNYVSWFGITLTPGIYFGFFAVVMIPVTLAFILVSKRFNSAADTKA